MYITFSKSSIYLAMDTLDFGCPFLSPKISCPLAFPSSDICVLLSRSPLGIQLQLCKDLATSTHPPLIASLPGARLHPPARPPAHTPLGCRPHPVLAARLFHPACPLPPPPSPPSTFLGPVRPGLQLTCAQLPAHPPLLAARRSPPSPNPSTDLLTACLSRY